MRITDSVINHWTTYYQRFQIEGVWRWNRQEDIEQIDAGAYAHGKERVPEEYMK